MAGPVTEDPLKETRKQATERRLAALEAHLADLEERFRPVDQFIGETARRALEPGKGM
jgi:hypothetical protein